MKITTKESNDIVIVMIEGSLDTNTSPEAQLKINDLIANGVSKIVVNFEKLDYISSSGLRILLATAKKLKSTYGKLKICCLNEIVQEVFDISGFGTILSVSDTLEKALQTI